METFKRTPLQLFHLPQHFVIPLFQRPYVWKEDEQWEPLWKDVRRVAELRVAEPHLNPQHFLGAVVLQSHDVESQRLTVNATRIERGPPVVIAAGRIDRDQVSQGPTRTTKSR